ncbi:serine/arginine repetitive matrix protein 5-like [Oppia nitens]|uniref:serine/arginine repetitive matrix protein 5-like n=1 Tax=Oppia nitens TaxID=1686743 RepID=UPI0023DA9839|nr:serine/arginine repetitive matrix protein 5-like [Oppia nitens]
MDTNSGQQLLASERKSVFERLGRRSGGKRCESGSGGGGGGGGSSSAAIASSYEEDLRHRMSRKRRGGNDSSPNRRSVSPIARQSTSSSGKTGVKSDDKLDTNSRVKSLVLAANVDSDLAAGHMPSVSSSSSAKRHKSHKYNIKCEDEDSDSEGLQQKLIEIQKQIKELDNSSPLGADKQPRDVSRSSSILSSEAGSYGSSLKSLTKTESSENSGINLNNKKTVKSAANKPIDSTSSNSKTLKESKSKSHVSSSISVKSGASSTHGKDVLSRDKPTKTKEVKLDRHGNVRVSLAEQEKQKRHRVERFTKNSRLSESSSSAKRRSAKRSADPKIVISRSETRSPPNKRSKIVADRHLLSTDHKHEKLVSHNNSSHRSGSSDQKNVVGQHDDHRADSSRTTHLDIKLYPTRDRSRDSRLSDRDNASTTSKHYSRTSGNYSREPSPTHSTHSKISRDRESSIGSDFSRRSKSERMSTQSVDTSIHNISGGNQELKPNEVKLQDTTNEDRLSSISTDESIADVLDVPDSPQSIAKTAQSIKSTDDMSPITKHPKIKTNNVNNESEDNFSDWSEDEDELLLKTDVFEAPVITNNNFNEDVWTERPSGSKSKRDLYSSQSKDEDALEAISDDELDAIIGDSDPNDAKVDDKNLSANRQVLNALDIDWGSLVEEPKVKSEFVPGSARKRFSAANVLMRIGFSQAYAGQQMTEKLTKFCQNELKDEFVPFWHPIAAVHSVISERIRERIQLFGSDSTPKNVLSGRKDLQIRKMLNKSNFRLSDNYLKNIITNGNVTTIPVSSTPQQPTTSSSSSSTGAVNELSVSSTNPIETHVSDIECY